MSFFVTLPSNASMKLFPGNIIGNYTTKLHDSIELEGEWEVGLAEILFPITWLVRKPLKISITPHNNDNAETFEIKFKPHETLTDIALKMSNFYNKKGLYITFTNDETRNRFSFRFNKNLISKIQMEKDLANLLGFSRHEYSLLEQSVGLDGDVEQDFEGLGTFLIYTDIIKHQFIGDANAKVLRVVALDQELGKKYQYINKIYDIPHYVPLERNNIEMINICLKDLQGETVSFESGKVVVKLHFRRKYY